MTLRHLFSQLNNDILVASGLLGFTLYFFDTAKEGFVSLFFNPIWVLLIFLLSGVIWLFTPENP